MLILVDTANVYNPAEKGGVTAVLTSLLVVPLQ